MSITAIILIAISLSMDTFAVSITNGVLLKKSKIKIALKTALIFSILQALLPVAGFVVGLQLKDLVSSIDHWIAFVLLLIIGSMMIIESFKKDDEAKIIDPSNTKLIIILGIATSIDALIVGASFAFIEASIIYLAIFNFFITFTFSILGFIIGDKIGYLIKEKAKLIGGLALIAIGIKILIDHTL